MARQKAGRAPAGRGGRPPRVEVSVSRLERHHVEALDDGPLLVAATGLVARRAAGEGFGLVAVVDGVPVGVLGIRTGDDGWALDGLAVDATAHGLGVDERLMAAAHELARPLGSLTLLDGTTRQL